MPEANVIHCPHCGQAYFVQPHQWGQYQGQTINCTRCGRPFMVMSAPVQQQPGAPVASDASPPPMGPDQSTPQVGMSSQGQAVPPPPPVPPQGFPPPFPPGPFPPLHPQFGAMYPPPPPRTSGLAIASLILGILSFCLPAVGSIGAVVTGIGGLVGTRDRRASGRGLAIAGLVLGLFTLVIETPILAMVWFPAMSKGIESAHRIQCAENIKTLGASLMSYAESHDNKYPEELDDLTKLPSPPPVTAYVCPSDSKTAPSSSPPDSTAADINSGAHCSYVYIGSGLRTTDDPHVVILYEPMGNHNHEGMNVLFADGQCRWLSADEAQTILDQRAKGTRPIKVDSISP